MSSRSARATDVLKHAAAALRTDRVLGAVVGLTVAGAVLRLVLLGRRIAHYDEGRVAYWSLEFLRTGEFHYRYIIHGPFIQHVDRLLFAAVGPSDFAARLPVAVVGTLLPLSALLFRERLRDVEVGALAGFFALNPLLLYYSRFMRSTLLVATFCFVAFGLFVRAADTGGARYVYAGAFAWALGFAAKENALVYLLCWLGAAALLVDAWLFRPWDATSALDRVRAWHADAAERVDGHGPLTRIGYITAVSLLVVAATTLFFYAPRSPDGGTGLWSTLFAPWRLPELVGATVEDIRIGLEYWFGRPTETKNLASTYRTRLKRVITTTAQYGAALGAFAVGGTVVERYVADRPRWVVNFAAYWGFASVLGYPLGTDIWAAWIIVNALVPLAIPAAVGLGLLLRAGRDALADDDAVSLGAAAVILLVVVGQAGVATATGVYANPTGADNDLVQFAQPSQGMRGSVDEMAAVAATNAGTDALVYGDTFVDGDGDAVRSPACIDWFETLPYGWYFETHDVNVTCTTSDAGLPDRPPPVIIAPQQDFGDERRASPELTQYVPDRYERREFRLRTTAKHVVVFVDPARSPRR